MRAEHPVRDGDGGVVRVDTDVAFYCVALERLGFDMLTRDEDGRVIRAHRDYGSMVIARRKLRTPEDEESSFVGETLADVFQQVMVATPTESLAALRESMAEERAVLAKRNKDSGDVGFKLAREIARRAAASCGVVIPGVGTCTLAPDGHGVHRRGSVTWNGGPLDST